MIVTIYWVTNDEAKKAEIRKYFNIPRYTSINGETEFEINKEMFKELKRGESKYIQIRRVENE